MSQTEFLSEETVQEITSVIADLTEALREFTRILVEQLQPAIEAFVLWARLTYRRMGLYLNLAKWLGFSHWNWWLAWHLPDWVVLRLPWSLVRWRGLVADDGQLVI